MSSPSFDLCYLVSCDLRLHREVDRALCRLNTKLFRMAETCQLPTVSLRRLRDGSGVMAMVLQRDPQSMDRY